MRQRVSQAPVEQGGIFMEGATKARLGAAALLLWAATPLVAQDTTRAATSSEPDSLAELLRYPPVNPRAKIKRNYDKFLDSTIVWTEVTFWETGFGAIFSQKTFDVSVRAAFAHPGKEQSSASPVVVLAIRVKSESDKLDRAGDRYAEGLNDQTLYLILPDSSRLSYQAKALDANLRDFYGVGTQATVNWAVGLTPAEYLRITAADRLEGKIGRYVFKLGKNEMSALRDLAALLNPTLFVKGTSP
jgi:hypothetical protein